MTNRRLAVAFVVLATLAAAGFTAATLRHHGVSSPAAVERATVAIGTGGGRPPVTGTVVSAGGLVLTAAHLVAPQADGVAASVGRPARLLPADPAAFTVTTGDGRSWPAVVAAVDGHLDLAVLRPAGPVPAGLAWLSVGSSPAPHPGTGVRVASVDGRARRVSSRGVVGAVGADPFARVPDPTYTLDTGVASAGTEGGPAVDDGGRLLGVAVAVLAGPGPGVWRLRDAGLARPLVAAAAAGDTYRSPWLVPASGREQVGRVGAGATTADACTSGADTLPSGAATLAVGFGVGGMTPGEAWAALIVTPDQTLVHTSAGAVPEGVYPGGAGCLSTSLGPSLVGQTAWPDGEYSVQLAVGPDLEPVGPVVAFTIGAGG